MAGHFGCLPDDLAARYTYTDLAELYNDLRSYDPAWCENTTVMPS